jgi:hypothetical protein
MQYKERNVLLIYLNTEKETIEHVQKILTGLGPYIKTRLGIHDSVLENGPNTGLVCIELVGDKKKWEDMTGNLNSISGVDSKLVSLNLN